MQTTPIFIHVEDGEKGGGGQKKKADKNKAKIKKHKSYTRIIHPVSLCLPVPCLSRDVKKKGGWEVIKRTRTKNNQMKNEEPWVFFVHAAVASYSPHPREAIGHKTPPLTGRGGEGRRERRGSVHPSGANGTPGTQTAHPQSGRA